MAQRLTNARVRVLDALWELTAELGMPPTLRQLQQQLGLRSVNAISEALRALKGLDLADNAPGRSRSWRVTPRGRAALGQPGLVPLLGRVRAGVPALSDESLEELIDPLGLIPPKPGLFCLRVRGDSMSGDGIMDNDLAFVDSRAEVHPGDIVVALVDGEATVKRMLEDGDGPLLMPSNPDYQPIRITTATELRIAGRVVAVHRRL
ncbi:MAG: transcriptional repressor LexA [Candidatus Alcyoniella australis]|nr:transcriptional repressor LexA [Candidatus Alcyoniella australis]